MIKPKEQISILDQQYGYAVTWLQSPTKDGVSDSIAVKAQLYGTISGSKTITRIGSEIPLVNPPDVNNDKVLSPTRDQFKKLIVGIIEAKGKTPKGPYVFRVVRATQLRVGGVLKIFLAVWVTPYTIAEDGSRAILGKEVNVLTISDLTESANKDDIAKTLYAAGDGLDAVLQGVMESRS